MVHTTLNIFDLIVFGVLGLSAIMSFFRGFVREFLSLGTWVGASVITLYAFPHVATMLRPHVNSEMVASGFAGLFTFMGALIILSVFSSLLLKFLKTGADVGFLNNMMGLVFGLARGTLLIAVGFYIFSLATAKENYPEWMSQSVSLPYVETVSAWVAHMAPAYLDEVTGTSDAETKAKLDEAVDDANERTEEIEQQVDDAVGDKDWPSIDDLKQQMRGDEPASGGY